MTGLRPIPKRGGGSVLIVISCDGRSSISVCALSRHQFSK
jgi:hypothetical protein